MANKLLFGDEIRTHVLKLLSGECVFARRSLYPQLYILSPWISDVVIDFSERYLSEEIAKAEKKPNSFFLQDYNIKSINPPYALLLFKLHSAYDVFQTNSLVNIVTLPPTEPHYSADYVPKMENLLNFLDEIGCNVFINPNLHSKLILTNDLALLGSFNLSSSALLYDREEIGVSINDLDNLEQLESYCQKVMQESKRFGFTSLLDYGEDPRNGESPHLMTLEEIITPRSPEYKIPVDKMNKRTLQYKGLLRRNPNIYEKREVSLFETPVTRGWLLDMLFESSYPNRLGANYGEFLNITGGYDRFIKFYAANLDNFYEMGLRELLTSSETSENAKSVVYSNFDYDGDDDVDSIMNFLISRFARKRVPLLRLHMKPLIP
jgi:hypothetical protein